MQPTYLPWLGYFGLMLQVENFVFFDHVQVVKRSWGVRNRIRTPNGELYLTVPLKKVNGRDETTFTNAVISYDQDWISQHLKSIEMAYKKAPFFKECFEMLKAQLELRPILLGDLNMSLITSFAEHLDIQCKFIRSSELKEIAGKKDDLLLSICEAIRADKYLSPLGAAAYIESGPLEGGAFSSGKVALHYQNYSHPTYRQPFPDFMPFMATLDSCMNIGFSETKKVIASGIGAPLTPAAARTKLIEDAE